MFDVLCNSLPDLVDLTGSWDLLGQAGGGGNFGGSSNGGGGSGGGGSGGGELIYLLIRFTIHYPHIGIPLIMVIVTVMYYAKKAEGDYRITRTIRRGHKLQEQSLKQHSIETIQARDPDFDQTVFLQRAANAFVTTQHAWSEQNLQMCRAFISDGVHERFDLYIAMQRAENIRNRLQDVRVTSHEIVAVTSDTHFDTIHVRMTASAISYNEGLKSGRRVSGNSDRVPISFTEIWSFSRRPGVRTNPNASLLDGSCPNCGGPVEIVDRAACPQCDSIVNSGKYDWVLAEITQDEEWVVPPARHQMSGWEQLSAKDPGLNFQHIEDRGSVIFWRSLMAVYFDDIRYAAPVLAKDHHTIPKLWNLGMTRFWKTPAVGAVEVIHCEPAGSGEPFDRIHVLVRWSATRAEGERRNPRLLDQQRIYSHTLILKRRSTAKSSSDQAFSSFSCQGCGAPIDVGKADVCEFCQASLTDGSTDWVLEGVQPFNAMAAYSRETSRDDTLNAAGGVERFENDRFLNEPELLAALAKMVASDGELDDKEKEYITDLAKRRGVPMDRLKQIFSAAIADDQPIQLPEAGDQARVFMDHLIRAALIDGRITGHEEQLLQRVSQQLKWAPADLKYAIARNRNKLYQQAKIILKTRP